MLLLPAFLGGGARTGLTPRHRVAAAASGGATGGDTQGTGEGAAAASGGATGGATAGDHASAGDATGPDGDKPDGGATPCKSGDKGARHDFELGLAPYRLFFSRTGFFASLNRDIPAQRRRFAEKVSGLLAASGYNARAGHLDMVSGNQQRQARRIGRHRNDDRTYVNE